jgi:uncharacterized protein affecting Mg2+/Co2+ transport
MSVQTTFRLNPAWIETNPDLAADKGITSVVFRYRYFNGSATTPVTANFNSSTGLWQQQVNLDPNAEYEVRTEVFTNAQPNGVPSLYQQFDTGDPIEYVNIFFLIRGKNSTGIATPLAGAQLTITGPGVNLNSRFTKGNGIAWIQRIPKLAPGAQYSYNIIHPNYISKGGTIGATAFNSGNGGQVDLDLA